MRVAVDGYNLAIPQGTGVMTYAIELVSTLQSMEYQVDGVFGLPVPADSMLREVAFFDAFRRQAEATPRRNRYKRAWHFLRAFRPPKMLAVPFSPKVEKSAFGSGMPQFDRLFSAGSLFENAFTRFASTGRMTSIRLPEVPDVMHWTYPVPLKVEGARNVYTLHDLVPLKLPYTTLDNKLVYGRLISECVKNAAAICTVSEASRRDIIERCSIDQARVINTYQMVTPSPIIENGEDDNRRTIEGVFGLEHRRYFLYCGAIEPKKNIGRLIEAYLSLQTKTPLVIVGGRSWLSESQLRLIPGGGASGAAGTYRGHRDQTIIRLDYLPSDLLAKLVRGARALVFPSLYEGFGLPVLEAMQLGTPVITSTTGALPEVAGDACLLVDPYDVNALTEAMRRLDADEALGSMMSARGIERAMFFSRERYQERLTELYRVAMTPQ